MRNESSLKEIERDIENLDPEDQLKLMEKLAHLLIKSELIIKKKLDWNELYGSGKGLWNGEDAQEYVNRSREERI